MAELITTKKELLDLFPERLKNLDVSIEKNISTVLVATYFQKDVPDLMSEPRELKKWINAAKKYNESSIIRMKAKLPLDIDGIYSVCWNSLEKGNITHKDTAILYFSLEDITEYGENLVNLNFIRKNLRQSELKEIGTKFYESLKGWLASKGYEYIMATPKHGSESYWKKRGQKPITEATREQIIDMYTSRGRGFVYFQQLR